MLIRVTNPELKAPEYDLYGKIGKIVNEDRVNGQYHVRMTDGQAATLGAWEFECVKETPKPYSVTRRPDVKYPRQHIWYGPAGKDGDNATSVNLNYRDYYTVTEYQGIDGYDMVEPEGDFVYVSYCVKARGFADAFRKVRQGDVIPSSEGWADKLPE